MYVCVYAWAHRKKPRAGPVASEINHATRTGKLFDSRPAAILAFHACLQSFFLLYFIIFSHHPSKLNDLTIAPRLIKLRAALPGLRFHRPTTTI